MHDLDRTQNLFEADFESNFEGDFEAESFSYESEGESDYQGEYGAEGEGVFDEVEEMELAAELLEVSDEAELDQFLGSLIKKAGSALGKVVPGATGKSLGGFFKGIIKKGLPLAAGALGNLVAPGVGGIIGGKLGSAAGSMFGLELEGLSPQDQEFEVARRLVRLAGDATQKAVSAPKSAPPSQIAKDAVIRAASKHAPGLVRGGAGGVCRCGARQGGQQPRRGQGAQQAGRGQYGTAARRGYGGARQSGGEGGGRWFRSGNKIVIVGA